MPASRAVPRVMNGTLTIGQLIVSSRFGAALSARQALSAVHRHPRGFHRRRPHRSRRARVFEILDTGCDLTDGRPAQLPAEGGVARGRIALARRQLLATPRDDGLLRQRQGISEIKAGMKVASFGPTGRRQKSTADQAPHCCRASSYPSTGIVTIDGVDVRE